MEMATPDTQAGHLQAGLNLLPFGLLGLSQHAKWGREGVTEVNEYFLASFS
jgi:hypothetical protein